MNFDAYVSCFNTDDPIKYNQYMEIVLAHAAILFEWSF